MGREAITFIKTKHELNIIVSNSQKPVISSTKPREPLFTKIRYALA